MHPRPYALEILADAPAESGVVLVSPEHAVKTRQGLPAFVGISEATAGSTGICMNLIEIPPGGRAEPHLHLGFETAIYLIEGTVETLYGPGLRERVVVRTSDFLYIAADVPHQPINLSASQTARAIVARNTPREQESVVPYLPVTEA
jgi:uncharacterized RmlC-like cupin family protein